MVAKCITTGKQSKQINILMKVSTGAKIRNRYNQVPHLTQDTNGKVTNSQKTPQTESTGDKNTCFNYLYT